MWLRVRSARFFPALAVGNSWRHVSDAEYGLPASHGSKFRNGIRFGGNGTERDSACSIRGREDTRKMLGRY